MCRLKVVVRSTLELFNNLFNPVAVSERGIDVYVELGSYRNFAAEEWTHELVWDLFVGRWIWLEGRRPTAKRCWRREG